MGPIDTRNRPTGVVFGQVAADVGQMKPQIIQDLGTKFRVVGEREARQLIDGYFAKIIWSLEKEEWDRMSEAQKTEFVRKVCDTSTC